MKVGVVLAVALLASVPAHAAPLMTAKDFNLFVLHNATVTGSDTEGRVAVGNDASFQPYSVASKAPNNSVNLVVGHDLTYKNDTFKGSMVVGHNVAMTGVGVTNGNITANGNVSYSNGTINGNISAGGTITTSGAAVNGTKTQNAAPVVLPVDFAAETTRLTTLSTLYASYNGGNLPAGAVMGSSVVTNGGGTVTLTGSGSGVNVFNITASMLSSSNDFKVNLTGGGIALINVTGTNDKFSGGMSVNGSTAGTAGSNVLFNFSQATNLNFYNVGVLGSILAPLASYNPTGWGVVNGQVVVKDWNDSSAGKTQINNVFLRDYAVGKNLLGDLPPPPKQAAVPEPSSWVTMVAGFGLLGGALRRSRRKPALA